MPLQYPRALLDEVFRRYRVEPTPDERYTMEHLLDAVFFTSLMIEEGEAVRIAVVHHDDGCSGLAQVTNAADPMDPEDEPGFGWSVTPMRPRPLSPANLAKLSRGLHYGAQVAVIGGTGTDLRIDGVARRRRFANGGDVTRLAAPRPGVLVFEYHYRELFRFEAGTRGADVVDMFLTKNPVRAAVGKITGDGSDHEESWSFTEHALDSLLRRMRDTGAGGILALLPVAPEAAVVESIPYSRVETSTLKNAIADERSKRLAAITFGHLGPKEAPTDEQLRGLREKQRAADAAQHALDDVIDDIGHLSAIDGAVLAGPGLEIYGGGYIVPGPNVAPKAMRATDVLGEEVVELEPHGARHQAAINFAFANPGGVAFVVSEDGPVRATLRVDDRVLVWPVRLSET